MSDTSRRIVTRIIRDSEVQSYVGRDGEIFYDIDNPQLKVSDGSTPGGTSVGLGSDVSINTTGIITASAFVGDGSGLTNLPGGGGGGGSGESYWVANEAGIHTTSRVGIGTTNPQGSLHISAEIDTSKWIVEYGDVGINTDAQYFSAARFDSQGKIYVSGADGNDGIPFVLKFDTDGSIIWQKFFEHPDPDREYKVCEAIAVDKNTDEVYAAVNPDDNVGSAILVKLNSDGDILWQQEVDYPYGEGWPSGTEFGVTIAVASNGNVYLGGVTGSQGAGGYDPFVVKFDSDGNEIWQRTIGSPNWESNGQIAIDSDENLYYTFYNSDLFLIKLDSDGNELWQRNIVEYNESYGVVVDSQNNAYVAGTLVGTPTASDVGLVKFDSDGNIIWQKYIQKSNNQSATSIAIDENDAIYVHSVDYSVSPYAYVLSSFDSDGNLLWNKDISYTSNFEWFWYWGVNYLDVYNGQLALSGLVNKDNSYTYSNGFLLRIPTSGEGVDGIYGDYTIVSSNPVVSISTYSAGISTLTVGISTLPISAAGLITATSPPEFTAEVNYKIPVALSANGSAEFHILNTDTLNVDTLNTDTLNTDTLNTDTLSLNGFPIGGRSTNFFVGLNAGKMTVSNISHNNFFGEYAGQGFGGRISSYGIMYGPSILGQENAVYTNVPLTGGSGSGSATVQRDSNGSVFFVNLLSTSNYTSGDQPKIDGSLVGGSSGINDITIIVYGVSGSFGSSNNFLGHSAGRCNESGYHNNFLGCCAGRSNYAGSHNNFFGLNAGRGIAGRLSGVNIVSSTILEGEANTWYYDVPVTGGSGSGATATFKRNPNGSIVIFSFPSPGINYNVGDLIVIDGSLVGGSSGTDDVTAIVSFVGGSGGSYNNFFGVNSGYCNLTGSNNNFFGFYAGSYNSTGSHNTFLGSGAGYSNTNGSYNIFLGRYAGLSNTTGACNTFIGRFAGCSNTTGYDNTFIGNSAGYANATGYDNNFLGFAAGQCNTSGYGNNFIGRLAGIGNTTGKLNNFIGNLAGYYNTTGCYNNFLGFRVGFLNTIGCRNNFLGFYAGRNNTSGNYNNFFGSTAGWSNTTGSCNNSIGFWAGRSNTTGNDNNFFGRFAGYCNTTGNSNNFFGSFAGYCNTTGNYNNFFGLNAGRYATCASYNNFLGYGAGECGDGNGTDNNFFGNYAGRFNSDGYNNNFFGFCAGYCNTTGNSNNFFGSFAGYCNTTGNDNNFFGTNAGFGNISGSNNMAFGLQSGNDAVYNFGSSGGDNRIVMGNNDHTNAYIKIAWTVTSDERDKNIVGIVSQGLSFVQQIEPIEYHWKNRETNEVTDNTSRYGLSAQQLLELEGDNPVIVDNNDLENLKVRESMLIPVLINAIKELSARVEQLENQLGISPN